MQAYATRPVSDVFGVEQASFGQNLCIKVFDPMEMTPVQKSFFRFKDDMLRRLLVWAASGSLPAAFPANVMKRNLMIYGPTGCGKSELVRQFCASTGRPLIEFTCTEETEKADFFGTYTFSSDPDAEGKTPADSSKLTMPEMRYSDGPVMKWLKTPNAVLLLDEMDQLRPTVAMSLNGVLDGGTVLDPVSNRPIAIPEGCLIAATANTNGRGTTGNTPGSASLYNGHKRQNIASLDRFFVVNATYLSQGDEKALLMKMINPPEQLAEAMTRLAAIVRSRFLGLHEDGAGDLDENLKSLGANLAPMEFTLTTRNVLNWGLAIAIFQKMGLSGVKATREALKMTLLDFCSQDDQRAVLDVWDSITGNKATA